MKEIKYLHTANTFSFYLPFSIYSQTENVAILVLQYRAC